MAALYRLTVRMDGWPGAPGFMTFYCKSPTPFRSAVIAFIDSVRGAFCDQITFTVPNTIDVLDDTTGTLTGIETEGTQYIVPGVTNQPMAAPAGACITWITNAFVNGRRLRGRTFLVPLSTPCYEDDGTLGAATVANFLDAAVDYFTACDAAIWHRPTTPGGSDGSSSEITAAQVRDRAAVLRSRRA